MAAQWVRVAAIAVGDAHCEAAAEMVDAWIVSNARRTTSLIIMPQLLMLWGAAMFYGATELLSRMPLLALLSACWNGACGDEARTIHASRFCFAAISNTKQAFGGRLAR
jgi:hypothetical protein